MGENGKIQLAWAPLMTATVAVPPLVACPLGGGEELEPPQPAATIAAPATTATPARRRVRLPRYIYAPLSWRTGAPLRATDPVCSYREGPSLASRVAATRSAGTRPGPRRRCRTWLAAPWPAGPSVTIEPAPLRAMAGPQRASNGCCPPTDRSERRWDLLTVRRRNRYDSSSISGGNGPTRGKSRGSGASDLVSRCKR